MRIGQTTPLKDERTEPSGSVLTFLIPILQIGNRYFVPFYLLFTVNAVVVGIMSQVYPLAVTLFTVAV